MIDIGIQKMKSYLAAAIECEKNVYIWEESMKRANLEMQQVYQDRETTKTELEITRSRENSLDATYKGKEAQLSDSFKSHKRRSARMKFFIFLIFLLWGVMVYVAVTGSYSLGERVENIFGYTLLCSFLASLPVLLLLLSKMKMRRYNISDKNVQNRLSSERENERNQLAERDIELIERCAELDEREAYITNLQEDIHESYNLALATRQKLYSSNILDARYQNFFCVATFYDYIETGKVITVNGMGGLAATLDSDMKHWEHMGKLDDLRAIAVDTNIQMRHLVDQAREATAIQREISSQLSSLNRTANYIAAQQTRTVDAANRIANKLYY